MAHKMWGVKLAMLVLGLLIMLPETMQLNIDHPLFSDVQKLNLESGPFLGLVIASGRDEKLLKNSTYFTPSSSTPTVTISGRKFHIGKFNGVPAIYVLAGEPLANVGVTVQILIDSFRMSGIIGYGGAATVSNKVFISNVVIPSKVSYTGSWGWQSNGPDAVKVEPSLVIGEYNLPKKGENALGAVTEYDVPIYTATSSKQKRSFWIDVEPEWFKIASEIDFGERPTVHVGEDVKVGSADVYLLNEAYGNYLGSTIGVTAVETQSAAIVTTAIANALPAIVIRGASNRPGLSVDRRLLDVTAKNVLGVVTKFVDAAYNITPQ